MKKTNFEKLVKKTAVDLQKDLLNAQKELRQLKFDLAMGKVKNATKVTTIKRNIARILTSLNQKQKEKKNG